MSADYSRIHRLLRILLLIQSEPGWNADRLAAECGTAVRTIYRDLDVLEQVGIPYHYDEATRGYRVRHDFFMPPVELTLDESLALIAMLGQVAEQGQVPFMQPAAKAIAKVRGQIPADLRRELGDIDQHVTVRLAATGSSDDIEDVYEQVRRAIAERRALRCSYESLGARHDEKRAAEVFRFEPYALLFSQRAWYAVGHHEGRGEVRKLKLNRFSRIELTDKKYEIPEGFSLEDHLGRAWRMIRGEQSYDVELWFDSAFAENVADTHWHPTQQIEWHDDGAITFRCTVDGLDEIVWWVLSMGPHCIVQKPAELAEQVRDLAARTAANYADDAEVTPSSSRDGGA
ncbi:MAG: helix-turn-helix transcriptional regulator [Phycisphaeraceae bacterium]